MIERSWRQPRLRDLDFYHFPHPRIPYEYDFGDSWLHWIEFDPQMQSQDGIKYPICIDGARHCPPEDVGGPRGYADFLKAWCDPTHQEHRAMQKWAGRSFDPEAFDIAKTNKAIDVALRRCRGEYRFRHASQTTIRRSPPLTPAGHANCRCTNAIFAADHRLLTQEK